MKGKLILCEMKLLKVLRSEPGWAVIWVLGPCPCPARAEGRSCVGETVKGRKAKVCRWPGRWAQAELRVRQSGVGCT